MQTTKGVVRGASESERHRVHGGHPQMCLELFLLLAVAVARRRSTVGAWDGHLDLVEAAVTTSWTRSFSNDSETAFLRESERAQRVDLGPRGR